LVKGLQVDSADHAQPQSASNGELRDDEATKAAKGAYIAAPTIEEVRSAHADLQNILKPRQVTGKGYMDPEFDELFKFWLLSMKQFMWTYINPDSGFTGCWIAASVKTANNLEKGPAHAKKVHEWTRAFIYDCEDLPVNPYGAWSESVIDMHPEIAQELHAHLQSIGKFVKAMDPVNFMDTPKMRLCSGLKKRLDILTAQRWMQKLDYRWTYSELKGQYVDGHEREDVVKYRNEVFLPRWANVKARSWDWANRQLDPLPHERRIVLWFHDESTFYANDWHIARSIHKGEKPTPYAKGEGTSEMVADLVSADFGWLRSPDGKEEARVLFKAGENWEGYFTAEDILKQVEKAIDILEKYYPDQDHVLVYGNVSTHQKRPDGSLSARKMPKFTSKPESNWLIKVNAVDANGRQIYAPNGKVLKTKIQMEDATFADGTKQPLYFPPGHKKQGLFKGMQVIMQERGLPTEGLLAQCPDFKCPNKGTTDCCCRRTLFNQPDFVGVKSRLKTYCNSHGVEVIFLPKFHCELNFIEQCWGYAKRIYQHYPASSKEADLERNLLASLEPVPLESMRKSVHSNN
jgi:transposase